MIKFTATHYSLWRPLVEDLLSCRDLFDLFEAKRVTPIPAK